MKNNLFVGIVTAALTFHFFGCGSSFNYVKFYDSAHHWYDINDEVEKIIFPSENQEKYSRNQVKEIADNILLFQRANGGWMKNYDMQVVLTEEQKKIIGDTKNDIRLTTIDNGATHSQIEYLAFAYNKTNDERYKDGCIKGIEYLLSAQYPNGGFPQFYPDTSGYRKYITFNDGAMVGVMEIFLDIAQNDETYSFINDELRKKVAVAFQKGLDCILKCQVRINDTLTVWGQQHDNIDFRPRDARKFEPVSLASKESAEITELLMKIKKPTKEVAYSIASAAQWFEKVKIKDLVVETVQSTKENYQYHKTEIDKVVKIKVGAPPIWARLYEIPTQVPLFCNRDGKVVYSLAEVSRERRTGYAWYVYDPQETLKKYSLWLEKHKNLLN